MMISINLKISALLKTTFASLKYKNYRYFWMGQCISLIGTWMQRTAQIWLVYTLTKSPFLVGVLGVCQFLPLLLFSLFVGVFVDRFPKKKILLLTQTMFMLQAIVLAILTFSNAVRYWHVFILSAVFGLTQTVDMPARQSFFIEMVGRKDLMNAISLNSTIVNLSKVIGPAISGIVIVRFGSAFCFLLNGLSYVAVLWGLLLITAGNSVIRRTHRNVWREIKEGLQYIKKSNILVNNVIAMAVVCTFAMNSDVIIPIFSKTVLGKGAAGYTALMSATGVGSFCAALFMANISKNGIVKYFLIIDALGVALFQIITSLMSVYWICLILAAGIGFINLTFLNTANSTFQLNSTDEYRGRVMSVYAFLNQGSTPIGNFFAGTVMEHWGGRAGFFLCGIATLLLIIPLIVWQKPKKSPR
jgi:MFS family permease